MAAMAAGVLGKPNDVVAFSATYGIPDDARLPPNECSFLCAALSGPCIQLDHVPHDVIQE